MFQPTLKPTAPNRFVEVKSEMTKTKIILVVLALSLVIMAAAGVAYAQSVSAQNQNGTYRQTSVQDPTATTDATHQTSATATTVTRKVHSKALVPTEWEWECVDATGKIQRFQNFYPFLSLIYFIQ